MTAIFQTNQPEAGKTTIRFTWWADTAKLQQIVGNLAQLLHGRGEGPKDAGGVEIPFASLTNQQKLNIIDNYLLDIIQANARQYRVGIAATAARDTAMATPGEDEFD